MTKKFKKWLKTNKIPYQIKDGIIYIKDFGKGIFINTKDGLLVDEHFYFIFNETEQDLIEDLAVEFVFFQWGSKFFYTKVREEKFEKNEYNEICIKPELNDFINVGIIESDFDIDFINLGVHTGYEMLNGSCDSSLYVDKAKHLNQKSLGVCEKNTLAGAIAFQVACNKSEIKPILGYTASVAYNYDKSKELQELFDLKFFIRNEEGWKNLLRINKAINVDNDGFIIRKTLKKYSKGLICVIPPESFLAKNIYNKKIVKDEIEFLSGLFKKNLYFQLDFTEFTDDEFDIDRLNVYKKYFNSYSGILKPLYISDSFYVEQRDNSVKSILNSIGGKSSPKSTQQYLKSVDEIFENNIHLFNNNEDAVEIFIKSLENTGIVNSKCNFQIDTGNHKLPKFEVKNPLELYNELIATAFVEKIVNSKDKTVKSKVDEYWERVETENEIIVGAGFIDYFLILWDVVQYAHREDILVGIGRGSAGGSLVAYLLGIIEIDPIKYNLLFERFLNKARVSGERAKSADSLPDIDIDFEGKRRDDIKKYIETKYGQSSVCSIGTFNRMKVKSIIKDFARVKGVTFKEANSITKKIDPNDKLVATGLPYEHIFHWAQQNKTLKNFIQKHSDLFELIKSPMNQQRSSSIHASAVVITPKEDKDGNKMSIYDWMPVRLVDGMLVSEWEGKYIDKAGFLKEDILGIAQLDKFRMTLDLIKENLKEDVDLNKDVDLKDKKTFRSFQKGYNEDVFQFGTSGLKTYSKQVKPVEIEDLISMNALYRPGPMSSKAHSTFVEIRNGKTKAVFDIGMEEVTKNTFGLYVYQEQVMQGMVVGGLSLIEADMVRTYIKKFNKEKLELFKGKFIKGYSKVLIKSKKIKPKKTKEYAENVWDKMLSFAKYGFNRSHAAAYSVMGYWSQWLKINYPLEFWTSSLNFVRRLEDYPNRLTELRRNSDFKHISVQPPDINKSGILFTSDPELNNIYWSFNQIKQVGSVSSTVILEERRDNGLYFDLEEFIERVPKRQVNKRVVINLIYAGAFDEMCLGLNSNVKNRLQIMEDYHKLIKQPLPEVLQDKNNINSNFFWKMKQKEITGFADLSFKGLANKNRHTKRYVEYFKSSIQANKLGKELHNKKGLICGLVEEAKFKTSKNNPNYHWVDIKINDGYSDFFVKLKKEWYEEYHKDFQAFILELKKDKTPIAVFGEFSYWDGGQQLTLNNFWKQPFNKTKLIIL